MNLADISTVYQKQDASAVTSTTYTAGGAFSDRATYAAATAPATSALNEIQVTSPYGNWDAAGIQTCNCDAGYFGPDCAYGEPLNLLLLST